MKILILVSIFSFLSLAQGGDVFMKTRDEFAAKVNLRKVPLNDLMADKDLPLLLRDTTTNSYLPSPFKRGGDVRVHLWAIFCEPCLQHLKSDWKGSSDIWINVDRRPENIYRAKAWFKENKIGIVPYFDGGGAIAEQLGYAYPVPVNFRVKDFKITEVTVGAKRGE
jgi:hypothetical protein